jgi:hypothetical protein
LRCAETADLADDRIRSSLAMTERSEWRRGDHAGHCRWRDRFATNPIARGNPGAVVGDDCLPLRAVTTMGHTPALTALLQCRQSGTLDAAAGRGGEQARDGNDRDLGQPAVARDASVTGIGVIQ